MTLSQEQTTREVAIQYPAAVPILESLGIDYCCGGARTLGEACKKAHVDWDRFVELLGAADRPRSPEETDWSSQPLHALTKHIVDTHHTYVRRTVPDLEHWLQKVVVRHGTAHPEVIEIRDLFTGLSAELATHMIKEERILFPHLDRLAGTAQTPLVPAQVILASVEAPVQRMMAEHDDAGELLAKIRRLANEYRPPEDACPTYRALYHGLAEFEQDLHRHVHLENNVLFPRALELQRQITVR